ncbi:MAG: sporulation initiation factor Spo0A [Clostridia bacterium]|nr:sporulation initiation factor Spo0A [Clostridia bacterium]
MTDKNSARKTIQQIAVKENVSFAIVYKEITKAIDAGFYSSDLCIRERWRSIPCSGVKPTPEDVIIWASEQILTSV